MHGNSHQLKGKPAICNGTLPSSCIGTSETPASLVHGVITTAIVINPAVRQANAEKSTGGAIEIVATM